MLVPIDNNISVNEYNKISKYNNLGIKIEKIYYLKTVAYCTAGQTMKNS